MKHLLLVRHAESRALAGEVDPHARDDSPLSGRGLRQAEERFVPGSGAAP